MCYLVVGGCDIIVSWILYWGMIFEVCLFVFVGIFGKLGVLCLVMLVLLSVVKLVFDNVEIGVFEGVV